MQANMAMTQPPSMSTMLTVPSPNVPLSDSP